MAKLKKALLFFAVPGLLLTGCGKNGKVSLGENGNWLFNGKDTGMYAGDFSDVDKVGSFSITSSVEQVGKLPNLKVSWDVSKKDLKEINIVVRNGKEVEQTIKVTDTNTFVRKHLVVKSSFGNKTVEVYAKCGKEYSKVVSKKVKVFSDEYVIAPLIATLPVSIFTLNMKEFTNNYELPTFYMLSRKAAWKTEYLYENVFPMPTATLEENTTSISYKQMNKVTSDLIKELHALNKSSKFHIYINDLWLEPAFDATLKNGIGFDKFDLTLLSDGTGSYAAFNELYDNENAAANVTAKDAKWAAIKNEFNTKKTITSLAKGEGVDLIYSMLRDEDIDVKWLINRVDTLATNKATIPAVQDIYDVLDHADPQGLYQKGRIVRYNLGTYYNNLSEAEKANLMKLYDLGTDLFEEAEAQGKKVMIILGTYPQYEYNFKEYLDMLQDVYGDEYAYFYKGHPRYSLSHQPAEMIDYFNTHHIQFLEPAIPAEFFFYFYPTVHYCGYSTSTFQGVGDEPSDCIFRRFEECTGGDAYMQEYLETFLSVLEPSDPKYGSLIDATDTNKFLVQEAENYDSENSRFSSVKVYDGSSKQYSEFVWDSGTSGYIPA